MNIIPKEEHQFLIVLNKNSAPKTKKLIYCALRKHTQNITSGKIFLMIKIKTNLTPNGKFFILFLLFQLQFRLLLVLLISFFLSEQNAKKYQIFFKRFKIFAKLFTLFALNPSYNMIFVELTIYTSLFQLFTACARKRISHSSSGLHSSKSAAKSCLNDIYPTVEQRVKHKM